MHALLYYQLLLTWHQQHATSVFVRIIQLHLGTDFVVVMYIALSEKIHRIFSSFWLIIHKPTNTLNCSLLRKPKDKDHPCQNVMLCISWLARTETKYIGETSRLLSTWFKEHLDTKTQFPLALAEHIKATGHQFTIQKAKILATEKDFWRRKVKDAIEIWKGKPDSKPDNVHCSYPL